MRRLIVIAVVIATQLASAGECMRLVPEKRHPLTTDGPGAFGPLHGLLTLGCLRFTGFKMDGTWPLATLVDERNRGYQVRLGSWIGESGGRITEITESRITLNQIVLDAKGEYVEVPRYIFRESSK